jgi:hypothetical protein
MMDSKSHGMSQGMGAMRGRGMMGAMQGCGMMQGMPGRKMRGMGRMGGMGGMGMGGMMGSMDSGMREDMMVAHQLVMRHDQVKRTVKQLENGVETLTESENAEVAALIKAHVPAMYKRLKENRPIHQRDPLFRELFRYGSKIQAEVILTPNGVRVTETSTDPYVVKLIKAHAKTVDDLVKRGMEAMHELHDTPKQ